MNSWRVSGSADVTGGRRRWNLFAGDSGPAQRRLCSHLVFAAALLVAAALAFAAAPAQANHAFATVVDVDGANDEPNQKDLTKLQVDDSHAGLGTLYVNWNWDDVTGFSGNNTGDACALIDTDQDGLVNFALCVTITDNLSGVPVQISNSPRLYSCDESPPSVANRRCTSSVLLGDTSPADGNVDAGAYQSTCAVTSPSPDDPFLPGDDYPNDTKAVCAFAFADMALAGPGSPTSGTLLNVCSYPSQQPNSDPSDCIVTPGAGFLTIIKVADPDDSTLFNFTLSPASLDGSTAFSTTGSGSVELIAVSASSYSITESVPAGWDLGSASCTRNGVSTGTFNGSTAVTGIGVTSGQETVCTFNNALQQGTLTVIKQVVNNSGGTLAAGAFTLHVKSGSLDVSGSPQAGSATGTAYTLTPGTYVVSEDAPPSGYAQTGFSGDCSSTGQVTMTAGSSKTCTITNDDIAPQLTVIKHVINDSGGTALAADFTMTVDDPGSNPADFPGAESPGTTVTVDPGSYSVSETGPSGYAQSLSADCSGSIAIGQTKTCTVTNNDVAPQLTVIKHVINDSGGTALAADFTMTVDDPGSNPADFPGAESPGTNVTVDPGSYSVSETGPSGYAQSLSADCSGSIAIGQTKTCTVTNNDVAPQLTVIKHVINDSGGTALAADFTMTVDDPGSNPADFPGAESPGTNVTVDPGSYSVSETGPSGYAQSLSADCSGSIAIGQTKTCTVTNNDIAPRLTVIKHVINDSGGTASASDFTMTIDDPGTNPGSFPGAESPGTTVTVDPGAYSVSETGPAGYADSKSADCSGSLALGQTKTCTVTNDDIAAQLTVIKHVINDSGGTALAADFTMTVDDPGSNPADFPGAESPGTTVTVDPGSYSVSETGPSGYAQSLSADCSGSIAIGQTKTCTVTNNDIAPQLTVIKHVINDSGGTALAADFTMTVDDPGSNPADFPGAESPGTTVTVDPGSYSVSETGPSGYAQSLSADCSGSIAIGQTKTCTVTNNDIAPQLTVIKHVINDSGGTALAADFTMTVDDPGSNPADFPGAESPGTNVTVDPGGYSVSESGPFGYAETLSADCSGAIAIGETKTCTVTNDDIAAELIVIKHVVNNSGGTALAGDFTMTVDDPGSNPADFPGAESPGTNVAVDPGSYSVSETGPSGYAQSQSADCSGSIAIGQTKTCTVTNNDIAPQLTVIKHVINDSGGTALAADFTMTVDDPGSNPGSFPGAESPGTTTTVDPGTYSVSETGPSGYAQSLSADCSGSLAIGETKTCTVTNNDIAPKLIVIKHVINDDGGTASASDFTLSVDDQGTDPPSFPGAESPGTNVAVDPGSYVVTESGDPAGYDTTVSADCDSTIAIGETKTCTVTNDDIAPKLIVIKHVINNSGGTASASAFTMTVDDPGTNPASFLGAESPGTNVTVDPGGYSVSETGPSGYAASQSADCSGTIAIGETKTCTVTNDDIAPKLIVIKHVINDSGGTASASDFTMTVDDPGTNPADFPGGESPGTTVTVDPGAYLVSETGPPGYAGTLSADCSGAIAIGQTKTCTVTNDDIAAQLTVIKHVVNNSGGTASAGDFTMTVDDPGTNPADFPGAESPGTNVAVDPGAYSVGEAGPSGYAAGFSADCSGTIAIGQTKTCTITNDDVAPKLTVIKHVVNDSGGTALAADFTMTVDDPGTNPADFPGAESPGTTVTVDPGSYSVGEAGPSGYAAGFSADCSGSIAIGQTKTCTITNDDVAPKLIVIKHVINDSGGTALAADFTMTVDDPGTNPADFPGAESPGTNVTVDPGSYSVSETGPSGYAQSLSADCSGSIAIGQTKTCTVTNNDVAPRLTVIKHVINDSGGTALAADFTMTVDDPGSNPADFPGAESPGTTVTVDPGSYSVSETGPSGYAQSLSADCSGSIAIGQTKTCTVTNNDIAPRLTVIKHVINDSGGTASASDFTMTIDDPGTNPGSFPGAESPGTTVTVDPGAYSVSETGPAGYADSKSADCSGSLALGQTKTCTVTNNDIAPQLTVIKHVINDSGGTASASDFTMTIDDPGTNPVSFPGAESPGTTTTVDPGTYSVSETGPSGYAQSLSTDCSGSLALGQTKTCTVTNNDIAAQLTVIKHVIGGTATAGDFTMTIDDPGTNPASFPGAESPGTTVPVDAGSYSVSESGPSGYTDSKSADCSGSIALGQTKTCTITNTRSTGTIEVIKKLDPTTDPGKFNLQVDGTTKKTDATNNSTTGPVTVDTGSAHSVGELAGTGTTLSNYTASIACTRNGNPAESGTGTSLGAIVVGTGDRVVCTITNKRKSLPGRMTGGGSILQKSPNRTTHGFELHCNKDDLPNNLQINWGNGQKFHLELLTSAFCFDDPAIAPKPPRAGFDTYVGVGTGRLNGVPGATAQWTFTDAGEPGTKDTATIKITDAVGNVVLNVTGKLQKGNQQAHAN